MTEVNSNTTTAVDLRNSVRRLALNDLLGPAGGAEEEIDETRVSDRYLVGMLAPKNRFVKRETDEEFATSGSASSEEGATEPSTAPADSLFPSSIGLTFAVPVGTEKLKVTATWGRYDRIGVEDEDGETKRVWKRAPLKGSIEIDIAPGHIEPTFIVGDADDVVVEGIVRKRGDDFIISLFLVNQQEEPEKLKDRAWVFQPELSAEAVDGSTIFRRRPLLHDADRMDPEAWREAAEMAMLYRREIEFAVGHGVAVHIKTPDGEPWRASRVATRFVPEYEVPRTEPPTAEDKGFEKLADLVLDMKVLADTDSAELATALNPLICAYEEWIEREKDKIAKPEEHLGEHSEIAGNALDRCRRALERIRVGIDLLSADPDAAESFKFANRAMWLQRIRSIYSEKKRRNEEDADLESIDADPLNHSWRPFQLAFILLNLESSTKLDHPERSHETDALADLLWFPTGGGKTEAYLGLTAYVLGLRRLQGTVEGHDGEHGVAVLMRYTLRLLTLQQFQRASALICACEVIRRADDAKWGKAIFRVGLWVGMRATPNTTQQASDGVAQARGGGYHGSHGGGSVGSPAQLTNCPWCGSKIDPGRNIQVEPYGSGRARTLTFCGDRLGKCEFSARQAPDEGLPIVVVDEEIYRLLPSLLIATVDKFAQMPWNGRTQMLFGRVNGYCPRHGFRSSEVEDKDTHPKRGKFDKTATRPHSRLRPPDLIIQDELHLISGPLGSLVGLYETAIDELCAWTVNGQRVRPKVIASTATIRNALAQVNALFLRRVEIFPPPGTSVEDNFFSIQRKPSADKPGRLYIGICAPGKRLKAILIRTYLAFLGASQKLYADEGHGKAVDPWMTLLGYFNSIRELGGMRRLVDDDIRTRLRRISIRGLGNRKPPIVEELTSRKSSTDIPRILDRLEVEFDPVVDAKRVEARKKGKRLKSPMPYDVVLATNMVSVGVDIGRLSLMVVGGQPKTTAEYIQASSRVGRRHPGIVCTVYNWARPRDLSHYERFEHYHATFYERVEALSVTPFAMRALDRALSALFVSLVRLYGDEFNENDKAAAVERDHAYVDRAIKTISQRAAKAVGDKDLGDYVEKVLKRRRDDWLARTARTGGENLGYRSKRDGTTVPLLTKPGTGRWQKFTCLNSLRDVEPMSGFILIDDPTDDQDDLEAEA